MNRTHDAILLYAFKEIQKLNPSWELDFESTYNFPYDSRKSVIVKCVIVGKRV
jgi:hypothetical protein